jgi:cellobiose-specific phosphotransferase system component IIA
MKVVALILSLFAASAFAANQSAYDQIVNQYTPSCRPYINTVLQSYVYAAQTYNAERYALADHYLQQARRNIHELMISDHCTLEDLRITMKQSEDLEPLERQNACMWRISEARSSVQQALQDGESGDVDQAIHRVGTAQHIIDELLERETCRDMPSEFQSHLKALQTDHQDLILLLEAERDR